MSDLNELNWSDIIPAVNNSISHIGVFISQFEDRELQDIEEGELQDFLGHLKDAQSELKQFRERHYYKDDL